MKRKKGAGHINQVVEDRNAIGNGGCWDKGKKKWDLVKSGLEEMRWVMKALKKEG